MDVDQPYFRSFTQAAGREGEIIRETVINSTGRHEGTGLHSFETEVLTTTFTLPWDLDPRVTPVSMTVGGREQRRAELLDDESQSELEEVHALGHTWDVPTRWQRLEEQSDRSWVWITLPEELNSLLDTCYFSDQTQFEHSGTGIVVDLAQGTLTEANGNVYNIDRLSLPPLVALKTNTSDIRSLLDALSMALWGVHDRNQVLETALVASLQDAQCSLLLKRRYQLELNRFHPDVPCTAKVWELSKSHISECPQLHIFALANVLKRPIIVYSDHEGNDVRGIYLPLLWKDVAGAFPSAEEPALLSPLVLGFSDGRRRFCPLVTFQGDSCFRDPTTALRIPLVSRSGHVLPVRFITPEELECQGELVSEALSTEAIVCMEQTKAQEPLLGAPPSFGPRRMSTHVQREILCARFTLEPMPEAIAALKAKRILTPF